MNPSSPLEKNERLALIGMILGIAGTTLCCGCAFIGAAGIIVSAIALAKLPRDNSKRSMALAGLICGIVGVLLSIVWNIVWVIPQIIATIKSL